MNDNIIPFQFNDNSIRVNMHDNGPWFNASDVCETLGFVNSGKALSDHVDPEDVTKRDTLTSGVVCNQ